jgi:hypothetical protein
MRPAADAMIFPSCPPLAASLPPWSVDEQEACFILRDANGQALAYVYFEGELGGRSSQRVTSRFSGGGRRPCGFALLFKTTTSDAARNGG